MLELAKRLTLLTPEQIEEVQALIIKSKKDDTVVEDNDGNKCYFLTTCCFVSNAMFDNR